MSSNPFDNLPDNIKQAIKKFIEKLGDIDTEEITNVLSEIFGKELANKIQDMLENGDPFSIPIDPSILYNFENFMNNLNNDFNFKVDFNDGFKTETMNSTSSKRAEVPHYEINELSENNGEVIVELPGVNDVRQIFWEKDHEYLTVSAELDDVKYYTVVELPRNVKLIEPFAKVVNSILIIPYRRI